MSDYLQAAVTIWALVNPVVCVTIFTQIEGNKLKKTGKKDATKASLVIFVVLVLAAVFGSDVLSAFGISLQAFQVTGGIVLGWMGFSMLRGADAHTKAHKPDGDQLAPLILFAASPGTITGVITIAITQSDDGIPVTALVGIAIAIVITWLLMLIATRTSGHHSRSSLGSDITTRFMGLIVVAMGVQFALAGYQSFMSAS